MLSVVYECLGIRATMYGGVGRSVTASLCTLLVTVVVVSQERRGEVVAAAGRVSAGKR